MKLFMLGGVATGALGVELDEQQILNVPVAQQCLARRSASPEEPLPASIYELLAAQRMPDLRRFVDAIQNSPGELARLAEARGAILAKEAAVLLSPVPRPTLIVAQGMAYRSHLAEMKGAQPNEPYWFMKTPNSVIGHEEPILLPPGRAEMVDWEGELAVIIGRECHRVDRADAMRCIGGYTILNDISARDWVAEAGRPEQSLVEARLSWARNLAGKQFPTFTPIGPALVTTDEIADPHDLDLITTVNGEVMQAASTSDLLFSIPQTLSYLTQWFAFQPGDIVSTGSPAGVGYGRRPQRFLQRGDVVEVAISSIGRLRNPVRAVH